MKKSVRILALILAIASALTLPVFAGEGSDVVGATYVTITGDDFVVDTLDGIPAYPAYQCNELAIRYYEEIYGVDIFVGDSSPALMDAANKVWFGEIPVDDIGDIPDEISGFTQILDTPEKGDIVYVSATRRGKSYAHTALVKSYDAEKKIITLIEQNWNSGGKAAKERKIRFPSEYYYVYRLTDRPAPFGTEVPVRVSPHSMELDGELVTPLGYNINGNNYYMLRDIAAMLSGTWAQFGVEYDPELDAIGLFQGEAYDASSGGVNREIASTGVRSSSTIYLFYGEYFLGEYDLVAYNINYNNYFKLRDIAELIDFGVRYDAERQMVVVDSLSMYDPEA